MSFAGQQETYLNVIGAPGVVAAVRDCWASLWTARAMGYRRATASRPSDVALAVVVQVMVPAEAAGVLFTANPVTGRRDEMVIDANLGLGEAVVSGQVEPDRYVVRRSAPPEGGEPAWTVAERALGAKATMTIRMQTGGGAATRRRRRRTGRPCRTTRSWPWRSCPIAWSQLMGVAAGHRVGLGRRQAAPAAVAAHHRALPAAARRRPGGDLRVYFNLNAVQGVAEPLTPLALGFFRVIADGLARFLSSAGRRRRRAGRRRRPALRGHHARRRAMPGMRRILMAVLRRGDPVAVERGHAPAAAGPHRRAGNALPRQVPARRLARPGPADGALPRPPGARHAEARRGVSGSRPRPPGPIVGTGCVWYVLWRASCPRSSRRSSWPSARSSPWAWPS